MDSKSNRSIAQINLCKTNLFKEDYQSLNTILASKECNLILSNTKEVRTRTYPFIKTLFTFIKQVLNPDKSCKNAVANVLAENFLTKNICISNYTGSYCKARKRLPEEMIHQLVKASGQTSLKNTALQWKVFGRPIKAVDGTTVVMPDTNENQASYPQLSEQKKGLGFPIARIVAVMSLTDSSVLDYVVSPYQGKGTGESTLYRSISDCIVEDDILLGDAYYPNFFFLNDLICKKVDGIFVSKRRKIDFRRGVKSDKKDHLIEWKKPNRPKWMDKEIYDSYPKEMTIREFKVNGLAYVTTFLDSKKYHKKELAKVYEARWKIELNLKSLKETMRMEMLSCKTPEMVRKEIGIHFLAYNFIRRIIAESCIRHDEIPNTISFKGSIQLINQFIPFFVRGSEDKNRELYDVLLIQIMRNKVGNRPGRIEPRAIKRRSMKYKILTKPRAEERIRLRQSFEKRISQHAES